MDPDLIVSKQQAIRALEEASALLRRHARGLKHASPKQQLTDHARRLDRAAASMREGNTLAQDDLIRTRDFARGLDKGLRLGTNPSRST